LDYWTLIYDHERIEEGIQNRIEFVEVFLRLNFPLAGRTMIVKLQIGLVVMAQEAKKRDTGVIAQKHDEKKSTPA